MKAMGVPRSSIYETPDLKAEIQSFKKQISSLSDQISLIQKKEIIGLAGLMAEGNKGLSSYGLRYRTHLRVCEWNIGFVDWTPYGGMPSKYDVLEIHNTGSGLESWAIVIGTWGKATKLSRRALLLSSTVANELSTDDESSSFSIKLKKMAEEKIKKNRAIQDALSELKQEDELSED